MPRDAREHAWTNFLLVVKGEHALAAARRRQPFEASPPFKSNIGDVADAGGVRVVAVAEHVVIDQVRRRGILPDLGIDGKPCYAGPPVALITILARDFMSEITGQYRHPKNRRRPRLASITYPAC
jgi:hypothetical protein